MTAGLTPITAIQRRQIQMLYFGKDSIKLNLKTAVLNLSEVKVATMVGFDDHNRRVQSKKYKKEYQQTIGSSKDYLITITQI